MALISKDLKTGECRTDFDMDPREYHAIGRVTVHWAYLEHGVYSVTKDICDQVGAPLPSDALNTSFKRRLCAFRLTIEQYIGEPDRAMLLRLHSQIANAEQDRHKITHGMWEYDPTNPERINASSFRPGYEFEKTFKVEKIEALADKIGAITFAMEYPEGLEGYINSLADEDGNFAFSGISRAMLRVMKGQTNPYPLDAAPSTPQEHKPPQPPLEE